MKNYQKIFNENAYCILTSNFSNKIVDNARQSFVGILKKSKNAIYKKIRVYDDYSSIPNIAGIENIFDKDIVDQDILNLVNESGIISLAKSILDEDEIVLVLSRYHVTNDFTHLGIWHRDQEPNNLKSVQINIYLYDESGMDIIPNSNQRKNLIQEDLVFNTCRYLSLKNSTPIKVDRGEILAFDPSLIHRGRTLENRAHLHFRFQKKKTLPELEDKSSDLNYLNFYNVDQDLKNVLLGSARHGYIYDYNEYNHNSSFKSVMLRIFRYLIHKLLFFLPYDHKIYGTFNVRPCLKKRKFFNLV